MCDFVPGEVLLSFPDVPEAAMAMMAWFEDHGAQDQVRVLERLDERLHHLDVPESARLAAPQQIWRVQVPPGQESYKSNTLRRHYHHALSVFGLLGHERGAELVLDVSVEPNHLLSLASPSRAEGDVQLTPVHDHYVELLGGAIPLATGAAPPGRSPVVAIVDSGVTESLGERVTRQVDLVSPRAFGRPEEGPVGDAVLHGTAVATVIADLAPSANLMAYRVADDRGEVTELDVVAALLTMADADIVNLSVAFGFARGDCDTCGRRANSSRSVVFEGVLDVLLAKDDPPIVVAASGNGGESRLSYPARFANVVAVGSHNSRLEVSGFSNRGTRDHRETDHRRVWFLPGGDNRLGQEEAPVVAVADDEPFYGTSFACAYASGLLAAMLADSPKIALRRRLTERSEPSLVDYQPEEHGHGRMTVSALSPGSDTDDAEEILTW